MVLKLQGWPVCCPYVSAFRFSILFTTLVGLLVLPCLYLVINEKAELVNAINQSLIAKE